jgi:SAM-dependent methyltransferase
MYFAKLNLWNHIGGAAVLHIAPEMHLAQKIQELHPRQYVRGDLVPNAPDIKRLDVTAIPYADESFDFLICNHVLEHVPDDRKALSEFHRVLKPGARAVLQTPFSRLLTYSFCDPAINTDALRTRFYFQEDMCGCTEGISFQESRTPDSRFRPYLIRTAWRNSTRGITALIQRKI